MNNTSLKESTLAKPGSDHYFDGDVVMVSPHKEDGESAYAEIWMELVGGEWSAEELRKRASTYESFPAWLRRQATAIEVLNGVLIGEPLILDYWTVSGREYPTSADKLGVEGYLIDDVEDDGYRSTRLFPKDNPHVRNGRQEGESWRPRNGRESADRTYTNRGIYRVTNVLATDELEFMKVQA